MTKRVEGKFINQYNQRLAGFTRNSKYLFCTKLAQAPSTRVEHDISKLRMYFRKILAEDESVSVCKAYRVGPVGTNGDSRPRPLKVILISEQDLTLLLSCKRKLVSFAPNIFFTGTTRYQSAWSMGRWRKKFSAGQIKARRILSSGTERLYHAPSYRNLFYGGRQ